MNITTTTFFIIFIPVLTVLLLVISFVLARRNSYEEKNSAFECGFSSFLGQNRTQFNISFFIFALLFLLFDLEILLIYPFAISQGFNSGYGTTIMVIFFCLLTIGFVFELGKKALNLKSRQLSYKKNFKIKIIYEGEFNSSKKIIKQHSNIFHKIIIFCIRYGGNIFVVITLSSLRIIILR